MHWMILSLVSISSFLAAKPVIDLYRWRDLAVPRHIQGEVIFERPNFTITTEGKHSHVALVTNFVITEVDKAREMGYEKIIGYLYEGRSMSPIAYSFVESNLDKFDLIFTFDDHLLKSYPEKCKFLHAMGYCTLFEPWIHEKTKLVSCMASYADSLPGHRLRRAIIDQYSSFFDVCKHYDSPWSYWKDPWIVDCCFSVIVENSQHSHYFTEKLIECFQAGTIPIYWGCPTINQFFDMDGVIVFNSLEELKPILESLSFEEYQRRRAAVQKNFELAKKYPTYSLTSIVHRAVAYNDFGHVIEEFKDRPDTYDMIWPYIEAFFKEEN